MKQVIVTADSSGNTPAVILDQYVSPFSVTYSASGSGTVQVSLTNPYPVSQQNFVAATYTWVTAPTTAPNAAGFLGQPYKAIRLSGGAEGDTLNVVQAGIK